MAGYTWATRGLSRGKITSLVIHGPPEGNQFGYAWATSPQGRYEYWSPGP